MSMSVAAVPTPRSRTRNAGAAAGDVRAVMWPLQCPAARREAGPVRARRSAFEWVAKLQRAFPGDERAVWTQTSLAALVDAAAQSPEAADAAYFTLEAMHGAVSPGLRGTAGFGVLGTRGILSLSHGTLKS